MALPASIPQESFPDMAAFSLYDLQPDLPRIKVLDVGASANNPAFPPPYAALLAAGRVDVTGFEPQPESCARLNEQYGPPHRFLPLFIGAGGPAKFYQTAFADCASLYKPNTAVLQLFNHMAEVMALVEVSDVATTRLDDVAEIDDVDFLTIDVQGAELAG